MLKTLVTLTAVLAHRPQHESQQTWAERYKKASNPRTSTEELVELASDPDWEIRQRVAMHLSTPASVLLHLARREEELMVREAVGDNPFAPTEALKILAADDFFVLRLRAALHPGATPEILATLATDHRSKVREMVAWNRNTPVGVLSTLVTDADSNVRRQALKNANLPAELRAGYGRAVLSV